MTSSDDSAAAQATGAAGIDDRTVVVTGAGTHLGRAMAQRLLREGFRCVLAGLDRDELRQTVALSDVDPRRATVVECDVRDPQHRRELVARASAEPGHLFGLVNNAAVYRFRPLLDETVADWRDTMETNLEAAYFLSQLAIEEMRDRQRGRIVNIASMHGIVGISNLGRGSTLPDASEGDRGPFRGSAYASSKGALIQLTRDLAVAVGRWGITVNAVSPGTVPPDLDASRMTPEEAGFRAALASQTPLGRLGAVEDIAGAVNFLLSDDASYVTGANLVVDGGFTAW